MKPSGSPRVLIVEDESLLAMMLEDMLSDLGWEVAANVASVPEALQAIERGGFDLALLDVNIAGREVFPVADALQARGVPLVFITGYGEHGIREDLRGYPVVEKPFHSAQLVRTLHAAAFAGGERRADCRDLSI
ncbi:response regulator [Vulcaniibacterium tengchongense]|uniref:Response regulator receiver domain-containing protein n=1 Tax=Vulcaniibacterium tengchongense TaxID=1273429 RepID=A0A3N4VNC6_9GAMM|nr:response regulator [Vulcaniibacterium tengchongense]RPE81339.1 response regulator receiver domain-containing protein [Vulcaniibacterium tengchongense]